MVQKLAAEFIGTFTLLFLGAGAIVSGKADLHGIALAHGLAIFVMVSAFGGISGGHFNPAVSAALVATGRLNAKTFFFYIFSQFAGALLASFLLKLIYGTTNGYGLTEVSSQSSMSSAFVAEAIGTAILVLIIFGVAVDKRNSSFAMPGLPIGLTISAIIFSVGPITGAALNPARWFGPALISGNFTNAWLFMSAPIIGAVIAAVAYKWTILGSNQ